MLPLLLIVAIIPAGLALPLVYETPMTPGEMAHVVFMDADKDNSSTVTLGELLSMFNDYDRNDDSRVARNEYRAWVGHHEPELVPFYDKLYDTFDMDGDHFLDLHDFVNLYLMMDPSGGNSVSEWDFIGFWTVLFDSAHDLHPGLHP